MEDLFTNSWIVGIGVTVIGGLILHYFFGVGKNQKSRNKSNHSQIISGVSKITPSEIMKNLDDLPLLQRKAIADNYIGLRIKWRVCLESVYTQSKGKVIVGCSNDDKLYPSIHFDIDLGVYPEFKLMKIGEKFTVEGLIKKVNMNIELKECILNGL